MPTDKRTADWYDQNASHYADHLGTEEGKFHFAFEKPAMYAQLPDLSGKQVLSLGCGPGEDSAYIKKQGAEKSVGIDISNELIKIARDNHADCEFHVMDMENLEFKEDEFDFIYSSLALHYLPSWEKVMNEAYRVLKPGGEFLFSSGHPASDAMYQTGDGESKEMYLGAKIDKQTHQVDFFGEYLNPKTIEVPKPFNIVFYHRSFESIFKDVLKAGFIIESILEPKPTEEMKEISPRHYKLYSTIPWLLVIKLKKPE